MTPGRLIKLFDRIADAPDAIGRLRRFILDLAARGKLVPQDPTDEPASELVKRIAAEKARLVETGAVRTQKPIRALSEDPFALPTCWRWSQIAEIGILSPRNDASDETRASFVPMSLIAAEYGVANKHETRLWGEINRGYTHFAEGDVGVAKITPCFENGKSTVFRNLTGGIGSGTTELHVVRPIFVDQDYVLIFFKSPYFIETGIPRMTGTAGQKRVPIEYFAHSPFPLPPLAEQHRVVAKVNELMALCDRLEVVRAEREGARDRLTAASFARLSSPDPDTLQNGVLFALDALPALSTRADQVAQLRQTILNLAVRGKLVSQNRADEPALGLLKKIQAEKSFAEESRLYKGSKALPAIGAHERSFPLPENWEWSRLRSLALALGDGIHGTPAYEDGTACYFINGNNLVSGRIVIKPNTRTVLFDEMKKHKKPMTANTVLVSINGTIGNIAFYNNESVVLGKSACYFTLSEAVSKNYIKLVLESEHFKDYALRTATGTTISNLSLKAMNEFPVPLPPFAEQHRIVAKVDELMVLCDRLEASLGTCDDTRRRLLAALLTEALVPGEPREMEAVA